MQELILGQELAGINEPAEEKHLEAAVEAVYASRNGRTMDGQRVEDLPAILSRAVGAAVVADVTMARLGYETFKGLCEMSAGTMGAFGGR